MPELRQHELRVEGGAGGVAARLEDLEQAGTLLRSVAAELADQGRAVVAVATDPGLQLTGPLSPRTFAQAEQVLRAASTGPAGLLRLASRVQLLGAGLVLAATAYRDTDAAAAKAFELAAGSAGQIVDSLAGPVMPGLLAGAIAVVVVGRTLSGRRRSLPEPVRRLGGLTVGLLADHAAGIEMLVPIAAGAIGGLADAVPVGRADPVARRRPGSFAVPDEVARFGVLAGLVGMVLDGHPWLREQGAVRVHASAGYSSRPTADVGEVLARIPSDPKTGQIHVERIEAAGGLRRWVVSVPGTADWSLVPGRTPFDLTGDVQLMAGKRSVGMSGVIQAMRAVGIGRNEPVLLVGYSQGGLIAAELAADPAVRREFRVSHLLTTGAPVASIPVPNDVQVLSIEHSDDLIPRLDGSANRDRPNWVTVSAPAPLAELPSAQERSKPMIAHRLELYQRTAARIAVSDDPSIAVWRAGVSPFLDGPERHGTAWDVGINRVGTS